MPDAGPIKSIDTLRGTSFLAIQGAIDRISRKHPDRVMEKIEVVRDGEAEVVLFTVKDDGASLAVRDGAELSPQELQSLLVKRAQLKVVDAIHGRSLAPIRAALAVFERHKPVLEQYKMELLRDGKSLVVAFTDKDGQRGGRGAPGARPGFEVEMNEADLRILRSNFIR